MKKRILSLIASGLLILPMVGCNAHLSVCGKEIFNFNDTQIEQPVQPKQHEEYQEDETTKDDILARLLEGEYTLYINENEYVYNTEEVLKALYDENPQYRVEKYAGTQYSVQVSDTSGKNFITFIVDEIKEDIAIVEFNHNGEFFEGQDASDTLSYVIYSELFNEEDATLTKKQYTTKEKSSKEKEKTVEKKQSKDGFYVGKDGCYHCDKCDAIPSKEEYNEGKCETCYFKGVEESYKEKHQYGDCVDCGVYLTKNQASSYGGRCPDCYAKYYGDNDTNMGYCERCGDRVDLDHTNDGWGYNHLCSACTGELQMEENEQDSTPWAG